MWPSRSKRTATTSNRRAPGPPDRTVAPVGVGTDPGHRERARSCVRFACVTASAGLAPVRALRIGYVGELGWELHVPTEFALHVYETLLGAGEAHGIRDVGYRAIESLRLEKGYLYWSAELSPDVTPHEAGLGFRVHLDRGGDFLGREALAGERERGPARRLCTFACEAALALYGGETLLCGGERVSLATSAGRGHTVGRTIALGYLERRWQEKTAFEIEVFGERHPIERVDGPLYDPGNARLKG